VPTAFSRARQCALARGKPPGKPRCFILVGGRHAAPRLAVNAFSRSLFGQLPCCNGRVETGAPEIASKASLKPYCEAGARTPCPGNTPSTRFPFLTTGTPPTSTNGIPSEYCSGFSYVALSMTVPGSKTVRSEEHTSELQSRENLVCRLLLEKKKKNKNKRKRD